MSLLVPRRAFAAATTALALVAIIAVGAPAHGADDISDGQWYLSDLKITAAHQVTQGEGVKVAVLDTGVDPSHPDLQGSVVAGADFSFKGPGDGLTDDDGHGTSMASLIVGHGQIKGIAPKATVVSIKVADGLDGSSTAVAQAIRWAIDHDIKIVSISSGYDSADRVLEEAVQAAVASNVVIVAAAGNKPQANAISYPGKYPGVLVVSGLTKTGQLSSVSVTGAEVSLAAPSDTISTAYKDKRRVVTTGTSNSAALTAGAAALVRAKYPNLSAADVVHRLTATAVDKGAAGRDAEYGYGSLNLGAALTANVPPLTTQPTVANTGEDTSPPIAAPGAEFPVGVAIAIGLGCLLAVVLVIVLVVVISRRRKS